MGEEGFRYYIRYFSKQIVVWKNAPSLKHSVFSELHYEIYLISYLAFLHTLYNNFEGSTLFHL